MIGALILRGWHAATLIPTFDLPHVIFARE